MDYNVIVTLALGSAMFQVTRENPGPRTYILYLRMLDCNTHIIFRLVAIVYDNTTGVIARTATVNTLLANVRQQSQGVVHAADLVIGRQHADSINRQTMVICQALRSSGDPAHNPGQGDEAINKPSTSCASMKTATVMTRSNTWNVTVSQKKTGETSFLCLWISLCETWSERMMRL